MVTTPPNADNESQTLAFTYDPVARQYLQTVRDGFGYTSETTHDLKYGLPLTSISVNGQQMVRAYDVFGRLVSVRGPYDGGMGAVTMEYDHLGAGGLPSATTINRASPPPGFGGQTPPPITTVTFADGLGRAVAVAKSASVEGQDGMAVSGLVSYDALGREVRRYHPFVAGNGPGGLPASALPPSTVPPATSLAYDGLDRVTSTAFPDRTEATTDCDLAPVPGGGGLQFHQRFTDANTNVLDTFTDLMDRTVGVVEHPKPGEAAVTRYAYLATGELERIVDAEGHLTQLGYDLRGLNTLLDNPDTGRITQRYDLMGNLVARQDPNHREIGGEVRFVHNRDRLERIEYPGSKPDVRFEYGPPGAGNNRAGRIFRITDETGIVERSFGALGEVRREVRSITQVPPGREPVVLTTQTKFDSLGRLLELTYPDGEKLAHTYDAGGNLASVTGQGEGFTTPYVRGLRYDVFGNRTRAIYGNGVESRWDFDPLMVRLEGTETSLPTGEQVQDLSYDYDAVGNPKTIESRLPPPSPGDHRLPGGGTWSFSYDGVDRLRTAQGHMELAPGKRDTFDQKFEYSKIHNLTRKRRSHTIENPGPSGGEVTPPHTNFDFQYTYDPQRPHHAVRVGDLVQRFDAAGHVVERRKVDTGSVQRLTWDDDGRLVEVQRAGTHLRNWYDSEGKRVIKRGRYGETLFANQYFQLKNGTQANKHVFAGGQRVATVLSQFNAGIFRPGGGGGDGGGGGGGHGGTSPGHGGEPPGQGGEPPGQTGRDRTPPGQGGTPPGQGEGDEPPSTGDEDDDRFRPGGPGDPPPPTVAGHPFYFHADHLGSTTVLTDPQGDVHEHLQYFPDGELWIERGPRRPINGHRFSGKFFDPETGFYDFEQRFYDPQTSLWLSIDPALRDEPTELAGKRFRLAGFTHVNNNPLRFTDPDGREPVTVTVIVVGAGLAILLTPNSAGDEAPPGDQGFGAMVAFEVAGGAVAAVARPVLGFVGRVFGRTSKASRGSSRVGSQVSKGETTPARTTDASARSGANRAASDPTPTSTPADSAARSGPTRRAAERSASSRPTARGIPRLSEAISTLGKTDARVIQRAAELSRQAGGTFADNLVALSRATTDIIGPSGQVNVIGELGGQQIFGSAVSRIGIVATEKGTLLVRAPAGKAVEVLGLFK
jgi:RHS repeat-associated protein